MKKLILFCAMFVLASCSKSPVEESSMAVNDYEFYAYAPEAQSDSRTYVDAQKKLHWTKGDLITIFHGLLEPLKFGFRGETGATSGTYYNVDGIFYAPDQSAPNNVAIYPYSADHQLNDSSRAVTLSMPAVQTYAEDSFGLNANTMVAVTSNVNDLALYFKNVGTYLNVRLWGENQTVKSITITATGGEALSGKAKVTPTYGGDPTCVMAINDVSPSVKLVCEEAVTVNTTEDAPVSFWIVLPPVTMEQGFTAMVENAEGQTKVFTIDRSVTFARNKYNTLTRELAIIHNNEIHYTATERITPYKTGAFGATYLAEQSTYDSKTQKGVLKFDGIVTEIGDNAFYNRNKLISLVIPSSVQTIGSRAFYDCESLVAIKIPNNVTTIGSEAFRSCGTLANVVLGGNMVSIAEKAFYACGELSELTINSTLTIGSQAFYNCDKLSRVYTNDLAVLCKCNWGVESYTNPISGASLFLGDSKLEHLIIPSGIVEIQQVFYKCQSLTSITIGNDVETIGEKAFGECGNLLSVNVGGDVKTIGKNAFWLCSSLETVTIGDSVTTIGEGAFNNCQNLQSVIIGSGIRSIEKGAFLACGKLTSIYCNALIPPTAGYQMFTSLPDNAQIYVPAEAIDAYKQAWKSYAEYIVGI